MNSVLGNENIVASIKTLRYKKMKSLAAIFFTLQKEVIWSALIRAI